MLRDIENSVPISTNSEGTEIKMVVCPKHYYRMLWALKSFYFFVNLPLKLKIYADLNYEDDPSFFDSIYKHFPNANVINTPKSYDFSMYPGIEKYCNGFPQYVIKLIDICDNPDAYSFFLDSDCLFYNDAKRTRLLLENEIPFYFDCGGEGYSRTEEFIYDYLGISVAQRFNSDCFACITPKVDLDDINDFFVKLIDAPDIFTNIHGIPKRSTVNQETGAVISILEQTYWGKIIAKYNFVVLPYLGFYPEYGPTPTIHKIDQRFERYHHIMDGKFQTFANRGVKQLMDENFIEKFNQKFS